MTSLFPPRESLVVTSRLGTGNSRTFFLRCTVYCKHMCTVHGYMEKKAEIFAEKERPTRPTTRINGHRVGGGGDWAYTVQAVDTYRQAGQFTWPFGQHGTLRHDVEQVFFSFNIFLGDFYLFFSYNIQHCFICRPSDSTVPTDAGIEPRTVATSALAVRCSNHQARSHRRTSCSRVKIPTWYL
jgi:hypothetical protein